MAWLVAVLDELIELRKNRPDLEPFFREDRPEPFFVKNLENVQGDERDRIILSVAYGLNEETGRDSLSFSPLNSAGGERRLNVAAVTRSREAITLVKQQTLICRACRLIVDGDEECRLSYSPTVVADSWCKLCRAVTTCYDAARKLA